MPRTPTAAPTSRPARNATPPAATVWADRLADGGLILVFLALTFLLGLFPLKDTDFWWHLRTGDEIRRTGSIPNVDPYTFGAEGHRWVDLHWLFQVLLSWGYQHGGIVALNLAKSAITCAAVLLLVWPPRREWPAWVMVLAWLPALYVLSGRMYVRPETLTLLYLAADLAVLARWDRYPKLAWALPVVQLFWVNTQGLFIFGPVLIVLALFDAALAPGAFAPGRRPWWRTALLAFGLTGLACIANPYGLMGAFYPFQLLQTMGSPVFRSTIAELKPVGEFIAETGLQNFQIKMHLLTAALGALSFLVPLCWRVAVRGSTPPGTPTKASGKGRKRKAAASAQPEPTGWRLRPFRLALFLIFFGLSWQATRNSHQYAAVVGAVTAWNFGEWAAALRARRRERGEPEAAGRLVPRLAALAVLLLAFAAVASGRVYALANEGRTIGLGEQPLWYPREATAFAGRPDMPRRFVCFHNGHAALFEYMNGADQKVYTDARLEVMGPELYGQYVDLERRIATNAPGWAEQLAALGDPGVLVDNVHGESAAAVASLMANPRYRCVWFDPIAAVLVPLSAATSAPTVDFAARHFRPDPATDPRGPSALVAGSRALRNVAGSVQALGRADLAAPLTLLGHGYARRAIGIDGSTAEAWKLLGQLEWQRDPSANAGGPRFRQPFDPVFDLAAVRTTYDLLQALDRSGDDFSSLLSLAIAFESRGMHEPALPYFERLARLSPINPKQRELQEGAPLQMAQMQQQLGPEPSDGWKNLDDLSAQLDARLAHGRAESAAGLLEAAYPKPSARPWDVTDRLATLWLHLGRPEKARSAWAAATDAPRPALRSARIAVTQLVQGDLDGARRSYGEALAAEPDLFEARYGLAVLERDDGRADAALAAADAAVELGKTDVARAAARAIVAEAEPYATGPDGEKAR